MPDPDLERIAESLRRSREALERDMDDTDRNIDAAKLLERIEALKQRMDATRAAFGGGSLAPSSSSS